MESEVFNGRSAEMRKKTPWLSSEDLLDIGKDVEVEIEGVFKHKDAVFDDGRKEDVFAVKFRNQPKQLVLNATNRKCLVAMLGTTKVAEWKGHCVSLYVDQAVRKPGGKRGETCPGIRIRPEEVKRKPAKPEPKEPITEPPKPPTNLTSTQIQELPVAERKEYFRRRMQAAAADGNKLGLAKMGEALHKFFDAADCDEVAGWIADEMAKLETTEAK